MATRVFYLSGPGRSLGDKLRLAAALVVGAGVVFAALVVSLSIAMVLIPVGAVAYLFRRQIARALLRSLTGAPRASMRQGAPVRESTRTAGASAAGERIIDAEYRVVPPHERDR